MRNLRDLGTFTTCLILLAIALTLGCARQITVNVPFDKSVDFFEKKYSVNFSSDREVVRYTDISGFITQTQQEMRNDELPGLPMMLTSAIVQADKGTAIKVDQYRPNECLQFCDQAYRINVKPVGGDSSSIRVRRAGVTADIFSRDAKKYLDMVQEEIASGQFQIQYRRTKLKNYGAIGKGIIDLSRSPVGGM